MEITSKDNQFKLRLDSIDSDDKQIREIAKVLEKSMNSMRNIRVISNITGKSIDVIFELTDYFNLNEFRTLIKTINYISNDVIKYTGKEFKIIDNVYKVLINMKDRYIIMERFNINEYLKYLENDKIKVVKASREDVELYGLVLKKVGKVKDLDFLRFSELYKLSYEGEFDINMVIKS